MKDFLIIIPTHSSYIDVVNNFLYLFKKNWPDCPYDVIISLTGENTPNEEYQTLYNGKNATLIDCIYNVTKKYNAEYYICFLGDAFIYKRIDNAELINQFNNLKNNHIDYCCLNYVKKYKKEKRFNKYFRYINNLDRYSHSFVAFVSSNYYINKELKDYNSDLDFELHYLNQCDDKYIKNHLIVRKNFLHILPCITKGKWDRINYYKVKKNNPEIDYAIYSVQSWKETIFDHLRLVFVPFCPNKIRIKLKKIIYKILKRKNIE